MILVKNQSLISRSFLDTHLHVTHFFWNRVFYNSLLKKKSWEAWHVYSANDTRRPKPNEFEVDSFSRLLFPAAILLHNDIIFLKGLDFKNLKSLSNWGFEGLIYWWLSDMFPFPSLNFLKKKSFDSFVLIHIFRFCIFFCLVVINLRVNEWMWLYFCF